MDLLAELYAHLATYLPVLVAAAFVTLVLWLARRLLLGRQLQLGAEARLPRQLLMLVLSALGLLLLVLLFPMSETTRGQVLSLLGVVITAVIALSSTTFVANAMAGLMLRMMKTFRPGDFIRIGEQLGRVSERGLFHTEIQTEDRDLTTFPNLYLVTNPVTVVHGSGTIISATLSLGYDIPRTRIEELLKQAALEAELQEPFVQVRGLGDFSVSYRVAGFLPEVKQLLTSKSNLHKKILDVLHEAGIEIVSPTFMNQRQLPETAKIIPTAAPAEPEAEVEAAPEEMIFDKAEEAAEQEALRDEHARLTQQLKDLTEEKKSASDDQQAAIDAKILATEIQLGNIAAQLEAERQDDAKQGD
jgi:small conductance mechanosensitive channel